jgi:hypothetical protein
MVFPEEITSSAPYESQPGPAPRYRRPKSTIVLLAGRRLRKLQFRESPVTHRHGERLVPRHESWNPRPTVVSGQSGERAFPGTARQDADTLWPTNPCLRLDGPDLDAHDAIPCVELFLLDSTRYSFRTASDLPEPNHFVLQEFLIPASDGSLTTAYGERIPRENIHGDINNCEIIRENKGA